MSQNNPINFRLPVRIDKSVHPSVKQALQDHDNVLTDLRQANATTTAQLNAALARITALEKAGK